MGSKDGISTAQLGCAEGSAPAQLVGLPIENWILPAGTKKRGLPKGARLKTFDALREKAAAAVQEVTK